MFTCKIQINKIQSTIINHIIRKVLAYQNALFFYDKLFVNSKKFSAKTFKKFKKSSYLKIGYIITEFLNIVVIKQFCKGCLAISRYEFKQLL